MMKRTLMTVLLLLPATAALAGGGEHHRAHGLLKRADANQDGMITREEFIAARTEHFTRLDRNSDGFLDDQDSQRPARHARHGERMRERFDSDGDGKISQQEFLASPTPMFDEIDADKSNVLDAQELAAAKERMRERMRERRDR